MGNVLYKRSNELQLNHTRMHGQLHRIQLKSISVEVNCHHPDIKKETEF